MTIPRREQAQRQLARRTSAVGEEGEGGNFAGAEPAIGVSVFPAGRRLVPSRVSLREDQGAGVPGALGAVIDFFGGLLHVADTANAYSSYWYRHETMTGKWWERYVNSVVGYKYSVWSDGNPFLDDYVGHPLMGSITNALWIENDPKGMTLEFRIRAPIGLADCARWGFQRCTALSGSWGRLASQGLDTTATTWRTRRIPAAPGTRRGLSVW